MPLTRRHTSRRVQFITGADTDGGLPKDLNWTALTDPHATTVVYMGRRTFPQFAEQLIAHGLAADTPALLAEQLGHADEKLHRTTIAGLAAQLRASEPVTSASVILFGALAEEGPR
jgi:uroporphyrin-III C-methyltransferase